VFIESFVVKIVEFHDSSCEWLGVGTLGAELLLFVRYHYRLLKQVGHPHVGLAIQFLLVGHFGYTNFILSYVLDVCLEVRIKLAMLDRVTELLATIAPDQAPIAHGRMLSITFFFLVLNHEVFIVNIVLANMFAELATLMLRVCLSTTPPDGTSPLAVVRAAAPIEIFRLFVVRFAIDAGLDRIRSLLLLVFHPNQFCFKAITVLNRRFKTRFRLKLLLDKLLAFCLPLFADFVELLNFLIGKQDDPFFELLTLIVGIVHNLDLVTELIAFVDRVAYFFLVLGEQSCLLFIQTLRLLE
jgi:hypothetical protein